MGPLRQIIYLKHNRASIEFDLQVAGLLKDRDFALVGRTENGPACKWWTNSYFLIFRWYSIILCVVIISYICYVDKSFLFLF